MTKTFCDYCGDEMEINGVELSAQLWNKDTLLQSEPAGEVFETGDLCINCSIILNEAISAAIKICRKKSDNPSTAELLPSNLTDAIFSIERILSDEGGMVKALSLGCQQMNNTTSPIIALLNAREKLQIIKKGIGLQ